MEKRGLPLAEIQEVPKESLILLSGSPGAGKSTFCHQAVLNGLAMDRSIIFVTTEHSPTEVIGLLRERGMGESPPASLSFVDAFGETVGAKTTERPDTIGANCEDLNQATAENREERYSPLLRFLDISLPFQQGGGIQIHKALPGEVRL
jgi:energy-coupling factor transporter ATP-binding protein EcfA2